MSLGPKIGFLGAGKMATALASGFIRAGLVEPRHLLASDPDRQAREAFQGATGSDATESNLRLAAAPTLVVAVKPAHVAKVLQELRGQIDHRHLVVSIAAGVTLARLEQILPDGVRVVRVMPNTPAVVGASATAYARGTRCTDDDARRVQELFSTVGLALEVAEPLLDAVTGLSGSGPAYAYLMIEALSDGGVAEGLPREVATRLAAQTLLGAARMVLETGLHPGVLKDHVTSPAGTTVEGLLALETAGARAAFAAAVRAATIKSRALASDTR